MYLSLISDRERIPAKNVRAYHDVEGIPHDIPTTRGNKNNDKHASYDAMYTHTIF